MSVCHQREHAQKEQAYVQEGSASLLEKGVSHHVLGHLWPQLTAYNSNKEEEKNNKGYVEAAHKEEINSEEQWGVTQSTQNHQKQRASLKDEAI